VIDILAIAAHPDDVEQTCGGTLLKMARRGYRAGVLDLTAGEMGTRGSPELRLQEAQAAGEKMRLAWRGNLGLPDVKFENTFETRAKLAAEIRRLRPQVAILPYWEARHPDHARCSAVASEACFLAGLRKLDPAAEPHRPFKLVYASLYANVTPSFVVDITAEFEARMEALLSYRSQYGEAGAGGDLFPGEKEIRERLAAVARFYGNLIGVKYGEPFVVKEMMQVEDLMTMGVRSS
jgi:bacillithiol biosynthesis deacetylase BshB1